MKFQQLKRKSIPAGQDLRVRLARLEDQDFVKRMNAEAGAQRPSDRITHPLYQSGIHAALDQPGGYFKRVAASYNATVEQDLGQALMNAIDTASFDLVAVKDGERVGMVSIGASTRRSASSWVCPSWYPSLSRHTNAAAATDPHC